MTDQLSRRRFLQTASTSAALLTLPSLVSAQQGKPGEANQVQLPQIHGASEKDELAPGPFLAPDKRVGYAIVGLGRLSIDQILPAFGRSQYSKVTALVSGDRVKALKLGAQYGIPPASIYDYATFDRLADNPAVQVIYIVLPNGMHEEFVIRGAKTGKHILCEKPMANSSAEAERMIAACAHANVKLMIAYRQQYEPHNILLRKMVAAGKLGQLRGFLSTNSQRAGDPSQWRLKKSLAGGGCLPDVGLYCLNAARFLSGAEPTHVAAQIWQPKDDPRFREVEAGISFSLQFPNGFTATCTSSYDVHKSQMYRLEGTDAWAELSPAFAYAGNKLSWSRLEEGQEIRVEPAVEQKDQFALEMDHFSTCILENLQPQTPGEEGLRDHRIMEAIYKAATTGRTVEL